MNSKDLVKFGIGHFINVQKMSRGPNLFYKKHEKSKVKHNGKVPLKLGKNVVTNRKMRQNIGCKIFSHIKANVG